MQALPDDAMQGHELDVRENKAGGVLIVTSGATECFLIATEINLMRNYLRRNAIFPGSIGQCRRPHAASEGDAVPLPATP